jgi:hypothetical protein
VSKFDLTTFAYELALIAEWLARKELPQAEETAGEIVQHAVESRFTPDALRLVATVGLQHPDVSPKLRALLDMMLADHIPQDDQEASEIAARRLATADLESFLAKLRAQQAQQPPDSI